MTKQEMVNHNIGLTFDFVRSVIDNPKILETLPDEGELVFIEKDFPIKGNTELDNKIIIKVRNSFEHVRLASEPEIKYKKKSPKKK